MATRWEVTKAVRASGLPSASRLVLFVLADVADIGTAEIPPKRTPSERVLAKETGLDRRTVQRHLVDLEKAGWIERSKPSRKAQGHGKRVQYRLLIPGGMEPPGDALEPEEGRHETAPKAAGDRPVGGMKPPLRRHETAPKQITDKSQIKTRSKKAAKTAQPGEETTEQRINRLAAIYTDRVKLSNFLAVRGVVKKAVTADVTDEKITFGLNKLADENRSVTTDSLRYAIYGVPPSQFRQNGNGHQPFTSNKERDYEAQW